ncbi:PIG-M-domain-containing protein [Gaertneriomyces semiglobifer]|nr:PIG-M-domain-containing protein [Gaertneriomyces semiglobifer]
MRLIPLLFASIALHAGFLVYSIFQDRHPTIKFTDIDYLVFTDGAKYISQGLSPYLRATYRYTPLLGYLVLPNVYWPLWGKLLFSIADLVTGALLYDLCGKWASAWLLNPFVIAISVRGNAESLVCALSVGIVWAIRRWQRTDAHNTMTGKDERWLYLSAVLLGAAVHWKVYPGMYGWCVWWALSPEAASFFTTVRIKYAFVALTTFIALTSWMYTIYGYQFLYETYLYHLTRRDHRHNFSVWFYTMYLESAGVGHLWKSLVGFIPQLVVVAVLGCWGVKRFGLEFGMWATTWWFVIGNKVVTSQYFMWHLCLLPLIIPNSKLRHSPAKAAVLILAWVAAQAIWLSQAYEVEHLGNARFKELWMAGSLLYLVGVWILASVIGQAELCTNSGGVTSRTETQTQPTRLTPLKNDLVLAESHDAGTKAYSVRSTRKVIDGITMVLACLPPALLALVVNPWCILLTPCIILFVYAMTVTEGAEPYALEKRCSHVNRHSNRDAPHNTPSRHPTDTHLRTFIPAPQYSFHTACCHQGPVHK